MSLDRIRIRVSPLVRQMLGGSQLFQDPAEEPNRDAQELRRAVLATAPRKEVILSRAAAGHLADYVDIALIAACDDGSSSERAAYRRTLEALGEQGITAL